MSATVEDPLRTRTEPLASLSEAQIRALLAKGDASSVPFRQATPAHVAWRERLLHVVAFATICYSLYYIAWRWTATLNPAAPWISIPLAAAESIALFTTYLLVFNVWSLRRREPLPAPSGRTVDVFITTYDEPVEVIRKTARSARDIRYPHRTWLLDDGRRIEVARLAKALEIGYLTRPDNRNAKAGNLNHALKLTDGEFILQLDADHVPLPHILDRLLGYMTDERVAFAQAPQNFYNTDAFSTHLDEDSRRFLNDQNIFFGVIQPGKDRWNAAFFCGSCAVLRRQAIEELGGFSTRTITEDIETSLLLHARGWKSVYHNEALAYGLAPRTASAYHLQRLRWARGGMQLLRHFNPLFVRGLTLPQRISYLSSVLHPLDGPVRIVFLAAPLIYLASGVYPIRSFGAEFLGHFLPYLFGLLTLHQLLARGRSGPIWFLEFGATARMLTQTISLAAFFTNRRLRFRVTPKGTDRVAWTTHLPHALLLAVSLGAIGWGAVTFAVDWAHGGRTGVDGLAFFVNLSWASWNAAILGLVVKASIGSQQRRPAHRFDEYLPFRFRVVRADGSTGGAIAAITENINGEGLAFRALTEVPVGSLVRISLPLRTGAIPVEGHVVHRRSETLGRARVYRHGVAFREIDSSARDAIELHCTQYAVPAGRFRYVESSDPFSEAMHWLRDPRRDVRRPLLLPVRLQVDGQASGPDGDFGLAVLEETSRGGARIVADDPVPVGAVLSWQVPGTTVRGRGRVVRSQVFATPLGPRHVAGVLRETADADAVSEGRRIRVTPIKKVAMIAGLLTMLKRFVLAGVFAGSLLCLQAGPLRGQLGGGLLGAAETADDGQSLVLLGGWLNGTTGAWRPLLGVLGYRLEYEAGNDDVVVWTANPFVGLRRQWRDTGLQFNVGYSFQDAPEGVSGSRQITSGVTAGAQFDHGNDGPTMVQAIGNWSSGDDGYIWSRLRVAQRVASLGSGPLRIGVEGTAQGGESYRAWEAGPILAWPLARGLTLVLGGGWRRAEPDGSPASDHGYARFDVVLIPRT